MKREIARYVSECDVCQRVKAEHLKPAGTLQPLPIPSWKWEEIGMDFITRLPRSSQGYDSIWVIVDHLTNITLRDVPSDFSLHASPPKSLLEILIHFGTARMN